MLKKIIKNKKGVIVSDAIVAILILVLFSGIIISLMTNIVKERKKMKINSYELDIITDIFEYADSITYDMVNDNNLVAYINNKETSAIHATSNDVNTLISPNYKYKIQINVEKYNETEGNTDKLDLIKIIHVKVKYTLKNNDYIIESSKVRRRSVAELNSLFNF